MRKSILFPRLLSIFLFFVFPICAFSQTNSYLGLDGGFEGLSAIDNTATGDALPRANKWVKANAALTLAKETTVFRSGTNSLKVTSLSSSAYRVWSPLVSIPESSSKWVMQYYRKATSSADGIQNISGIYRGTTEVKTSTYSTVSTSDTWEKVVYLPASITSVTAAAAGLTCKRIVSGGDMYFDDFCLYESSTGEDIIAPDVSTDASAHLFSSSSLVLNWRAPSTGTDGGGYLVVRGITDPIVSPNQNGIYAVGNMISTDATVVYQGSQTNFIDTVLITGVKYYYRIYTYDKAYNYSSSLPVSGSVAATPPSIAITQIDIPIMSTTVGCPELETISLNAINLIDISGVDLTVSGTNANFFSLSKSNLSQSNGIVSTTPVRIIYRPTDDGTHSAILTAYSGGIPYAVRNLSGTARRFPRFEHRSDLIFLVRNGCISFLANLGDVIELYNALGQRVVRKIANEELNSIPLNFRGVVIVKVGDKIGKAIL